MAAFAWDSANHHRRYRQDPGVAYVLDGSVRKSGARLRVAARLIGVDNGYVVWSETYDRPFDDILMVQDDIAGEVTKALRASIEARPDHAGQP
jgi:TolB-like protein